MMPMVSNCRDVCLNMMMLDDDDLVNVVVPLALAVVANLIPRVVDNQQAEDHF